MFGKCNCSFTFTDSNGEKLLEKIFLTLNFSLAFSFHSIFVYGTCGNASIYTHGKVCAAFVLKFCNAKPTLMLES